MVVVDDPQVGKVVVGAVAAGSIEVGRGVVLVEGARVGSVVGCQCDKLVRYSSGAEVVLVNASVCPQAGSVGHQAGSLVILYGGAVGGSLKDQFVTVGRYVDT